MPSTMRPFTSTIPIGEALRLIDRVGTPIERIESVPLDRAAGRILSVDVTAGQDVPPFDRAAMDGYAVRAEDTRGATSEAPRQLRRVDTIYTGHAPERPIGPGECAEISTGAPLPAGADAVVMVEETRERAPGEIAILSAVQPRQHVGRRGSDIARGQAVVPKGALLTASRLGALAALGLAEVSVFERPRVAILSTGNEIVGPGRPLGPGQIYDINRFTLEAIVREHGGVPAAQPAVRDTIDAIEAAVEATAGADLMVFSGGSSVGTRDLMIDVVGRRGTVLFHGIAVKPGKPTLLATIGGMPVLGLPGNPTSCLSNAYLLLIPVLRRTARLPVHVMRSVVLPLATRIVSTTNRHQFYTVRAVEGKAVPAFKGSGDITSMAHADGYIEIPANVPTVEAGEMVEVKLF